MKGCVLAAVKGPHRYLDGGREYPEALPISMATKIVAVQCYSTQFPAAKAGIFGAIETMNRYHGLTAGFEAGELFLTYRSVGVDDLMRWASPAHCRT